MRLTLRTMLAYMDQILEPQDAHELQQRIESSDRAESLMARIRACMKRIRLDSPDLNSRGVSGDLNNVAEYLDNTLPPERVPDFERICLENDEHLAEIAASHQILAQALGKRTNVPPGLRQRLYALGTGLSSTDTATGERSPAGELSRPDSDLASPRTHYAAEIPVEADSAAVAPPGSTLAPGSQRSWRTDPGTKAAATTKGAEKSSVVRSFLFAALIVFLLVSAALIALLPLENLPIVNQLLATAQSTDEPSDSMSGSGGAAGNLASSGASSSGSRLSDADAGNPSDAATAGTPSLGDPTRLESTPRLPQSDDTDLIDPALQVPENLEVELSTSQTRVPDDLQLQDGSSQAEGSGPSTERESPSTSGPQLLDPEPQAALSDGDLELNDEPDFRVDEAAVDRAIGLSSDSATQPVPDTEPAPNSEVTADTDAVADRTTGPSASPDAGDLASNQPAPTGVRGGVVDPLTASPERGNEGAAVAVEGNAAQPAGSGSAPAAIAPDVAWQLTDFPADDPLARCVLTQAMDGIWSRMAPQTQMSAEVPLLNLPVYRPRLKLDTMSLTLVGATRGKIERQLDPAAIELNLDYGNAVLSVIEGDSNPLRISWGDRQGTLTLEGTDAMASVSVTPMRIPGTEPTQVPSSLVLEIVALGGNLIWQGKNADAAITLKAMEGVTVVDQFAAMRVTLSEPPAWTNPENVLPRLPVASADQLLLPRQIDVKAAEELERLLPVNGDPIVALREATKHRRAEVRTLAARALVHVGQFDPLLNSFTDINQKSAWPLMVAELSAALARGPETATKVREAIERTYPSHAQDAFRILIGYHPQQLREGGAQILVDQLEEDALIRRILAFETLKEITGGVTFYYQPEDRNARRLRTSINRWKQQLADGKIVYTQATTPRIISLLQQAEDTVGQ